MEFSVKVREFSWFFELSHSYSVFGSPYDLNTKLILIIYDKSRRTTNFIMNSCLPETIQIQEMNVLYQHNLVLLAIVVAWSEGNEHGQTLKKHVDENIIILNK